MKSSCTEKLRHMRQASRWRLSACTSTVSSSRSQASERSLEARRQSTRWSAAMGRILAEPAGLQATAQGDARAVQDHPAIGRRDLLVPADRLGVVPENLAAEEHPARRRRQSREAALERFPEATLVERRLGIAPGLRRHAPVAGLVEVVGEPALLVAEV